MGWSGLVWAGLSRAGLGWSGLGRTGQVWADLGMAGHGWVGMGRTGQGWAGQGWCLSSPRGLSSCAVSAADVFAASSSDGASADISSAHVIYVTNESFKGPHLPSTNERERSRSFFFF